MDEKKRKKNYKKGESSPGKTAEQSTVEGRNPVTEALLSGVPIDKILVSETAKTSGVQKLVALARERRVPLQFVDPRKVDALSRTKASQGVVALCSAVPYADIEDIFRHAEERGRKPFVVLADEITDPHNLGAIIRSANAAGADGVCSRCHGGGVCMEPDCACDGTVGGHGQVGLFPCCHRPVGRFFVPDAAGQVDSSPAYEYRYPRRPPQPHAAHHHDGAGCGAA